MAIQVGTAVAQAGALTRGELRVGSMADGSPINLPVLIATGRADGPTVWVQGAIHGEEYGGPASIVQFMRTLDISQLRGTVVGLPVANPTAFNIRSRFSSLDGGNLNRLFPGDARGSYSPQLAAFLGDQLARSADYLLDLHSGGIGAEVPSYCIFADDGTAPVAKSKALAKRLGFDVLWRIKGEAGFGSSVIAEATRRGIPSVTIEVGGGRLTPEQLRDFTQGITNGLRALEMLPGEAPVQPKYTIISDGAFLFNQEGGLFIQECPLGSFLAKDAVIGRLVNLYGDTVEEIRNPYENAYIAALKLPYYPTHAGEIVAEAIPVEAVESI